MLRALGQYKRRIRFLNPLAPSWRIYSGAKLGTQAGSDIEPWPDSGRPIEQAATPPSSWYTNSAVCDKEQTNVFWRNWQMAAHTSQLEQPGAYVTGNTAGMPWVVCRDAGGRLRAWHNVCRHHAAAVASGAGTAHCFTCPYHGWTYGLDGRLLAAKKLKGIQGFRAKDNGLLPLSLSLWGPFVFVAHRPQQPDLAAWLGEGGDRLLPRISRGHRHVGSQDYTIRCNWKVFCDNYLDGGYHVPAAHPALAAGLDMRTYTSDIYEHLSIQTVSPSAEHSSDRLSGPLVAEPAEYAFLYCNLMLNIYGEWMDTNIVTPLGVDACQVRFDWYLLPDAAHDADTIEECIAASHEVQLEDVGLCEDVQQGLQSPAYNTGRYAPSVEAPMFHFHQLLNRDLFASG